MNLPTLKELYVSENIENKYAQIIAEEDIRETYGETIIYDERE